MSDNNPDIQPISADLLVDNQTNTESDIGMMKIQPFYGFFEP
jgi:hypothetical protein